MYCKDEDFNESKFGVPNTSQMKGLTNFQKVGVKVFFLEHTFLHFAS